MGVWVGYNRRRIGEERGEVPIMPPGTDELEPCDG